MSIINLKKFIETFEQLVNTNEQNNIHKLNNNEYYFKSKIKTNLNNISFKLGFTFINEINFKSKASKFFIKDITTGYMQTFNYYIYNNKIIIDQLNYINEIENRKIIDIPEINNMDFTFSEENKDYIEIYNYINLIKKEIITLINDIEFKTNFYNEVNENFKILPICISDNKCLINFY